MKLYWVTNIPTPYRNHRYRTMQRVFPQHGIDFEVLYMAHTEPNRHWDMPEAQFTYPQSVFPGVHPVVRGWTGHFNPKLLQKLRKEPADVVLIGGFACPTHWLAPLFCPVSTKRVMMVESNLSSARMMGRASRWFKRRMLLPNNAFIVPSPSSKEYILKLAPESVGCPFFELPNLVDDSVWVDEVKTKRRERAALRRTLGIGDATQLWICPARLVEDKGLHLFLPTLAGLSGLHLLIAGDGPLRRRLEKITADLNLPVTFLGQQSQAKMVDLYAAADLFVLPSLRDASPLSAVEACASALPLLVSRRIGNLNDVLSEGENGASLDILSPKDVVAMAERALQWSPEKLEQMGYASYTRYRNRFSSETRIAGLADFFLSVSAAEITK